MTKEQHRPELIIWGSGSGTTFRAIAEALAAGLVDFDIPLVITDKDNAGILQQVDEVNTWQGRDSQIETMVINQERFPRAPQPYGQTLGEAEETCKVLQRHSRAVLLLAGCTRSLGDSVIRGFGWRPGWVDEPFQGVYKSRIIKAHPGKLPETGDTYGIDASRSTIELGLRETAYTLVAEGGLLDGGPTIAEHLIDVPEYDIATIGAEPAARHLFEKVVQPVGKAHLPFDVANFLLRRQIA